MIKNRMVRTARLALLVLVVAGCATQKPITAKPYSKDVLEVLSGVAILGHPVNVEELPYVDLFSITPEMETFARRAVRRGETYFDKVKALQVALLSAQESGGYGIKYNAYVTEPPITTFAVRRANCLSFTLLYVAMARAVGINAYVNEVSIPPTWDLRNKKDMVFLRHVNVKVSTFGKSTNILRNEDVVIDLAMNLYRSNYHQYEIDDTTAAAQFYSNRAMEYLDSNNYAEAFLNLRKSIELNPLQSYVWSNLGALYGRKKLLREAELVYKHALELNPNDFTVMNNLAYLYQKSGNQEQFSKFFNLAQRYRESNPYYQYNSALSAFDAGDYQSSLTMVLRAIDREKNDVRFYELAVSLYEKLGRHTKAMSLQPRIKKLKKEFLQRGE